MMHVLILALAFAFAAPQTRPPADPVDVISVAVAPVVDGNVGESEYGRATAKVVTAWGEVPVWLVRHGGFVYVAAALPDSTYYWGDDFVVSVDPDGSGGTAPAAGDMQWYLRRALDSSVVNVVMAGAGGDWYPAGKEPASLGSVRARDGWSVASSSRSSGWSVELRVPERQLMTSTSMPRVAIRTYNDNPHGWWSLPAPSARMPASSIEGIPDRWLQLRFR